MSGIAVYDDDEDDALLGLDGTPFSRALVDAAGVGEIDDEGGAHGHGADVTGDTHATRRRNKTVLVVAFVSFFLFAVAEVLGGIFGKSLALASDAATMLVDAVTYLLNLFAEHKKAKASTRGILLYELSSPTFSVIALIATTIYILVEAVEELQPSSDEDSPNVIVMWFFTLLNLSIDIVNIFLFVRERRRKKAELVAAGHTRHEANANMLSALTHVAIDTMRTLSVFIALVANRYFGLTPEEADAYASIAIAIITFFSTVPLWRVLSRKLHRLNSLRRQSGPISVNSSA